jgi:hypothetical protein
MISTQKRGKDSTKHIQAPENGLVATLTSIVCRRTLDGTISIVKYEVKHIDHTASCSTAPLISHIMSTSTPRDLRRNFAARANFPEKVQARSSGYNTNFLIKKLHTKEKITL